MASSVGIHIDQRRFHLVALEGSVKKHRMVAHLSGQIMPGDDPVAAVSSELRRAAKENKLKGENVALAVDSGLAAFRNLSLPFDDRAKIEEVLKYEIENDLPQWDIDDVICDFLVLDTKPGVESHLLVTAIPKMRLERQLEACERAGLEALDAQLDGTALFAAASEAGILAEDAAHILVHVGDASTTVVVADGSRLASMRAIRAGAAPPVSFEEAEEGEGEGEDEASEEAEGEDAAALQARLQQTAGRIRRELGRTISGAQTEHPIEAIYVAGYELYGEGEEIFDVPVMPLDAVPSTGEGPAPPELVVAYGAALGGFGGGELKPHLRREELRFTGKFERLELPLAVFTLLLFTLLAVKFIVLDKQINWRDEGDLAAEPAWPGDMQLWLQYSNAYLLPDPKIGYAGRLKDAPKKIRDYIELSERGEDADRTKYGELLEIRRLLKIEIDRLKRELGQISDIKQPQSALEGMTLVMGVFSDAQSRIGRYGIRSLSADYAQGRSGSSDYIEVKMDLDFFAEDDVQASQHYNALQKALRDEAWCIEVAERPSRPFEAGGGMSVEGFAIKINVETAQAAEAQEEEGA